MFYLSIFIYLLLTLGNHSLQASTETTFPTLHKGRYQPAISYAQSWLHDYYRSHCIKSKDHLAFHTTSSSPIPFLLQINSLGTDSFRKTPLFWIQSSELKTLLQLTLSKNRFHYDEIIQNLSLDKEQQLEEWSALLSKIKEFEQLLSNSPSIEKEHEKAFHQFIQEGKSTRDITLILEQRFPLIQRLKQSGRLFYCLPAKMNPTDWLPLRALTVQVFDQTQRKLIPVGNFTSFSDALFAQIKEAYFQLDQAIQNNTLTDDDQIRLAAALQSAYVSLAGETGIQVHEKRILFPSLLQLEMESMYSLLPWIPFLIFLYAASAICYICVNRNVFSLFFFYAAIFLHTVLLCVRSYILGRPPVSNMFETMIYVPWIAACATLCFPSFRKQPLIAFAGSLAAIFILLILQVTDLNQGFDQVQAVLDSQFWLLIHVMMVVGSYGVFALGAFLAHIYVVRSIIQHKENAGTKALIPCIAQTIYLGTFLLMIGTILGGIWAAESWGRFWDWDPKESWAFISICIYLIWIHAYRFHHIGSLGLVFGAIIGMLAISFTWYGVNYILGTGLHSYGFGSGGEIYYSSFLLFELAFILFAYKILSRKKIFVINSK